MKLFSKTILFILVSFLYIGFGIGNPTLTGMQCGVFSAYAEQLNINPKAKAHYEKAKKALDEAVMYKHAPDKRQDLERLLNVVIKESDAALKLQPDYIDAFLAMGEAYSHAGDFIKDPKEKDITYGTAAGYYLKAMKVDKENPTVFNNLGMILLKQGKYPQAEGTFKRALELDPDDYGANNNLGVVLIDTDRMDEAIPYLEKASQLDPKKDSPYANLGYIYFKNKDYVKALNNFNKALDLNPMDTSNISNYEATKKKLKSSSGFHGKITLSGELSDKKEIIVNTDNVKKEKVIDPEAKAHYENAKKALDEALMYKRAPDKRQDLERLLNVVVGESDAALRIDGKYSAAWLAKGEAYSHFGDLQDDIKKRDNSYAVAAGCYFEVMKIDPNNPTVFNNLGMVFLKQEKYTQAEGSFKRALELDPDDATFHNNLGSLYKKTGRIEEAISEFKRSIEIDPNSDLPYGHLGTIYYEKGDIAKSRKLFQKASDLDPYDKVHKDWLAFFDKKETEAKISPLIHEAEQAFDRDDFEATRELLIKAYKMKYQE